MKYLILLIIRLYWLFPKSKRRRCIFKKSCSNYVFETTQQRGLLEGLKAFYFRYKNCRGDFEIFKNPITSEIQMLLPSKKVIGNEEIAERLLIGA